MKLSEKRHRRYKYGLETLSVPALSQITKYLEASTIVRLSRASKRLRNLISRGDFWSFYYRLKGYRLENLKPGFPFADGFYFYIQRFIERESSEMLTMIALEASSCDSNNVIDCTLDSQNHTFWNSIGSQTTDVEEYLSFSFRHLVMLKHIEVDFHNSNSTNAATRFYMSNEIVIMLALTEGNWFYVSEPFLVNQQSRLTLEMNKHIGVAKYVKLVFREKLGLNESNLNFYVGVKHVRSRGVSLDPENILNYSETSAILKALCNYYVKLTDEEFQDLKPSSYYSKKLKNGAEFIPAIHAQLNKFKDLLGEKLPDKDKLEFLEKHKYLLADQLETFDLIYENDKKFSQMYFKFLKYCKRKIWLSAGESYLLCLVIIRRIPPLDFTKIEEVIDVDLPYLFYAGSFTEECASRLWDKFLVHKQAEKIKYLATLKETWNNMDGVKMSDIIMTLMGILVTISRVTQNPKSRNVLKPKC